MKCPQFENKEECSANMCQWTGNQCRPRDTKDEEEPYIVLAWLTDMKPLTNAERFKRFGVWFCAILVAYVVCRLAWHQSTLLLWKKQPTAPRV